MAAGDAVRAAVAIVWGLVLVAVGVALATNFRRVTEWHVGAAMGSARRLERVPPWRWLRFNAETQRRRMVWMERLFGVAVALTRSATFVIGVVWFVRLVLR